MKKKWMILLILLISVILINGCVKKEIPPEKYCEKDGDCVPNKCCHAEDVVNINYAPNCTGAICTKDCRTILDCGYGEPICKNNLCTIKRLRYKLG